MYCDRWRTAYYCSRLSLIANIRAQLHTHTGDYSATHNNPYCEGNSKGAGFCSFQMRGDGPGEKTWYASPKTA